MQVHQVVLRGLGESSDSARVSKHDSGLGADMGSEQGPQLGRDFILIQRFIRVWARIVKKMFRYRET
jgi:hypothetical protein